MRQNRASPFVRSEKYSLNKKFLGGIFLGHPGPSRLDIPDKNFMQVAFFCCFRQGVARMSWDLGWDVPDLENFMQEILWADFSYPNSLAIFHRVSVGCCQRTTARKTPATSHGVGSWRGVDQELANF